MSATRLEFADGVAWLTLNRPERHNSLVPALIDSLNADLDSIVQTDGVRAVVLRAAGSSFSTGGDVAGFHSAEDRHAYAETLVGGLNRAIIKLLGLPMPLIGRIHGPLTGGSLGLLLPCDLAVIAPQAFIQPYYTEVGFSPDGGWTAMLPARIGTARAREIQLLNRRITALEAVQLGLATTLAEPEAMDAVIAGWIDSLKAKQPGSIARTKALLYPDVAADLLAEQWQFQEQIVSAEADAGMARFLAKGV